MSQLESFVSRSQRTTEELGRGVRLRSRLVHGAMPTTQAAGQAATEGRLPSGEDLRMVPPADDYRPALQTMAGVFARKGERENYHATHPLNPLWHAFKERARSAGHVDASAACTNES